MRQFRILVDDGWQIEPKACSNLWQQHSTTLKKLLAQEVQSLEENRVYFELSGGELKLSIPAINLFLYHVATVARSYRTNSSRSIEQATPF